MPARAGWAQPRASNAAGIWKCRQETMRHWPSAVGRSESGPNDGKVLALGDWRGDSLSWRTRPPAPGSCCGGAVPAATTDRHRHAGCCRSGKIGAILRGRGAVEEIAQAASAGTPLIRTPGKVVPGASGGYFADPDGQTRGRHTIGFPGLGRGAARSPPEGGRGPARRRTVHLRLHQLARVRLELAMGDVRRMPCDSSECSIRLM